MLGSIQVSWFQNPDTFTTPAVTRSQKIFQRTLLPLLFISWSSVLKLALSGQYCFLRIKDKKRKEDKSLVYLILNTPKIHTLWWDYSPLSPLPGMESILSLGKQTVFGNRLQRKRQTLLDSAKERSHMTVKYPVSLVESKRALHLHS